MLSVNHITHVFEDRKILNDISFEVKNGEILAIIGESGSGKSTLLNLISGHIDVQQGEILMNNTKILGPSQKLIAGMPEIKLIAQDYRLNPNFTVAENIKYSIRAYTKDYQKQRSDYLMNELGINELKDKLPKQISGGEKQRTAIAKSLAELPDLLLLDEPMSNLDNLNRKKFKNLLSKIIENEQLSAILVTHDFTDALQLANKIAFLKDGQFLDILLPSQIKNYSGHWYIKEFIDASLN